MKYCNLEAIAMATASYNHYREVLGVWGVQSNWNLPVSHDCCTCMA